MLNIFARFKQANKKKQNSHPKSTKKKCFEGASPDSSASSYLRSRNVFFATDTDVG